jgi:hypothetical protein
MRRHLHPVQRDDKDDLESLFVKRMKTTHIVASDDVDMPSNPKNINELCYGLLARIFEFLDSIYFISCTCALTCHKWHNTIHSYIETCSEWLWYRIAHRKQFIKRFEYLIGVNEIKEPLDIPFRDSRRWYQCVKEMVSDPRQHYINSVFYCLSHQFKFSKEIAAEYIEDNLLVLEQIMPLAEDNTYEKIPFQISAPKNSDPESLIQFDMNIPLGKSKIGGCPDLPQKTDWPKFKTGDMEIYYDFLAQFNLDHMDQSFWEKIYPLYDSGMLYFFIYMDDSEGVRINNPYSIMYFANETIEELGGLTRKCKPYTEDNKQANYIIIPHSVSYPTLRQLPRWLTKEVRNYIQKKEDFSKIQALINPLWSDMLLSEEILNYKSELDRLFPLRIVNCRHSLLPDNQELIERIMHYLRLYKGKGDEEHLLLYHKSFKTIKLRDWKISLQQQIESAIPNVKFDASKLYFPLEDENPIDANDEITIVNKRTGVAYTNEQARSIIGIPKNESCVLNPKNYEDRYTIFYKATDLNFELKLPSQVLYNVEDKEKASWVERKDYHFINNWKEYQILLDFQCKDFCHNVRYKDRHFVIAILKKHLEKGEFNKGITLIY